MGSGASAEGENTSIDKKRGTHAKEPEEEEVSRIIFSRSSSLKYPITLFQFNSLFTLSILRT